MNRRSLGRTVASGGCGLAAMALVAACGSSSNTSPATDSGTTPSGLISELSTCGDGCSEYVVDSLEIPTTENLAELSYDFNGDGTGDNKLAQMIATVAPYVSGFDAQAELAKVINEGSAIVLLRTVVNQAGAAAVRAWVGNETCCTSEDPTTCAAEAQASCFSGTHTFSVASDYRDLEGTISSGQLSLGPGQMYFDVKFFGDTTERWTLKGARLQAQVTSSGLIKGRIFGAISEDDLSRGLVTGIAQALTDILQDPTPSDTKTTVAGLFDDNGDGIVDVDEVSNAPLVGSLLKGDVDIDNDGVNELTVGFGFTAVPATIDSGTN